MNGILNLFKPSGITSFDAIRRLRRLTGEKKMGHLGTLDPMAEGVLPLFFGKYTKLIPHFNLEDKVYRAEVTLGASSTTLDKEGELTPCPLPPDLTPAQVEAALARFVGKIWQVPPMFSAIKIEGKRLYQLAREGKEVEREARPVTLYSITQIEIALPQVRFTVHCSKGTYIRTLAEDLGQALGTNAYLSALCRTKVGSQFGEETAVNLDQIENSVQSHLLMPFLNPVSLFSDWNRASTVSLAEVEGVKQGNPIVLTQERLLKDQEEEKKCLLFDPEQQLLALGHLAFSQDGRLFFQPKKVLV